MYDTVFLLFLSLFHTVFKVSVIYLWIVRDTFIFSFKVGLDGECFGRFRGFRVVSLFLTDKNNPSFEVTDVSILV